MDQHAYQCSWTAWKREIRCWIWNAVMFQFRPPKIQWMFPKRKENKEATEEPLDTSKTELKLHKNSPQCPSPGWSHSTRVSEHNQSCLMLCTNMSLIPITFFPKRTWTRIDQTGMAKYVNWTEEMAYGRVLPLRHKMANFADPKWGNCSYDIESLRRGKGYGHVAMKNYTSRWNKVLRHDIGHAGKSTTCDELGWVSIEEIYQKRPCMTQRRPKRTWPPQQYMEWPSLAWKEKDSHGGLLVYTELQAHQMIAALLVGPSDLHEVHRHENPDLYNADRLARSGGWIRPVAIRATAGPSFTGQHQFRLCANIDQNMMNMKPTKELSFKLAGGIMWPGSKTCRPSLRRAFFLGGTTYFFGEYPLNSSTLAYLGSDTNFLLVMYVPVRRLLKYRASVTYNSDVIVRDMVPFHEVQDVWIAGKSPELGKPAANPKKISNNKIVNEAVSMWAGWPFGPTTEGKNWPFGRDARKLENIFSKPDGWKCHYCHGRCPGNSETWIVCSRFPRISCDARNVVGNSSVPVSSTNPRQLRLSTLRLNLITWSEKERTSWRNWTPPKDDDLVKTQSTKVVEEKTKEEFSPEEEKTWEFVNQNVTTLMTMEPSWSMLVMKSTSLSINFERLKVDLNDDMVAPAFFIDSVDRISRYLLFKLADYIVNAYPPWHKYVFEETDIKSRKLLVRHDVAGQGHPVAKNGPGEDDFELNRGLPVTMGWWSCQTTLSRQAHCRELKSWWRWNDEKVSFQCRHHKVDWSIVPKRVRSGWKFQDACERINKISEKG